jgi:hypothetical protein
MVTKAISTIAYPVSLMRSASLRAGLRRKEMSFSFQRPTFTNQRRRKRPRWFDMLATFGRPYGAGPF